MANNGMSRSLAGGHNPWLIAIVVSIATFMEVLDTAIANVSLRHIAGDLSAGIDESTWVLTSYLVANAIVLPISGWLGNVMGRKRFYMLCVGLFSVSSLMCGLAPSLGWLIFFRVLQGMGGGGLAPSEQSILADSFRPEQRGMAFALYGVAVVFAPAIGPTLGGWITDNYSWHWIFLINVPVGIVSLLLTYFLLVEPETEKKDRAERKKKGFRVDVVGFGLVAVGLGCMQVVLDKGQRDDWFGSNFIIVFTVVSVAALIALVVWELSRPDPIVDLRLYGIRSFASANVLMFALGFILFGTTQLLPQMVQSLFGYTAAQAGEVITPGGFAVILMMPAVGFMVNKVQPRYLIGTGMLIEFFAMWHMSHLSMEAAYSDLMWARIYQAAGIAFLFVPITTASYAGVPGNKSNEASALINLMRNLGGSFGISLGQTWLARRQQFHQTRLVSHLTPTNPTYQQWLAHTEQAVRQGGTSAANAMKTAAAQLGKIVGQQAEMLSYIDVFRLLAWCALGALPLVLLLKKVEPGKGQMH
ncbi:MAG TPA: DHA2 family efflux MFS transporter permease subunit [Tepidisphaeraceae bacterium]|jgi:DHA2 family multidrug resistance protein|nr:DHA2 family efflux MFS transporter permease subunit [Tepidisphaeraceae bacterium]